MQPTIKILFTGLLNFYYDETSKKFEIGALMNDAHCLTMGVCKVVSGSIVESKVLTYFDSPDDPSQVEVIDGDNIIIDVQKNNPGAAPFPSNKLNDPPTEAKDFRHSICIDGAEFHPPAAGTLSHQPSQFPKVIEINDGSFYSELRVPLMKEQGGSPTVPFDVAWYIGADINLDSARDEVAVLKYSKNGAAEEYRMEPGADTNYNIFIENGCHNEVHTSSPYTDFAMYYDVFNIPDGEKIALKIPAGSPHKALENTLVLNNPIIWYTRKLVWGSSSPLNFGFRDLELEESGGNVRNITLLLHPDNLCVTIRTLNKYH